MQPTPEQSDAIDLFNSGLSIAIEAGAGTGKTSTLTMLGNATTQQGQYLAFNRSIVEEAGRKLPRNVKASTAHSLAMRAVGGRFRHRLGGTRMRSMDIARRLGVDPMIVSVGPKKKVLQPSHLASLVMKGVLNFCFSDDPEPLPAHLPYIEGIDLPQEGMRRTWMNNMVVRDRLAPMLRKAWVDLSDPDGTLPYKHDHYLKFWALNDPHINADFVLFDEAQDASPIMIGVVARQENTQLVWTGDSQQSIYGWRGAVNALQAVPFDSRTFLTQSFRFGPEIAEIANLILGRLDAELRLRGLDTIESTVGFVHQPDAILTRTNAVAVRSVLQLLRQEKRVHLVGGGDEIVRFAKAALELQKDGSTWHPELACFTSWQEVLDYVDQDPSGDELALSVRLLDEFGAENIIDGLSGTTAEGMCEIVVSTAHKAKGREWSKVQLADDFPEPADDAAEEWRLLYVACTRARNQLDVTRVDPLRKMLNRNPEPQPVLIL